MLDWFAEAPDPDAGLFGFRRLSESLGRTPWYLKTLRDEGQVAERLAKLLATSRYVSDLLEKEPAGVRMLGEDLAPLEAEQYNQLIVEEMLAAGGRRDDPEAAVRAIRAVRRRELFRVAAGDSLGLIDVADVGAALSRITDATLEATLQVVLASVALAKKARGPAGADGRDRDGPLRRLRAVLRQRRRRAVRARGRRGRRPARGVVVRPRRGQRAAPPARAARAATRRWRSTPTCGPRASRARCRAASSPTRRTTRSGRRSGRRRRCCARTRWWATTELRRRFVELVDPLRYPAGGLSEDDVVEVRRIKARVDQERLPRGADPNSHLKLGRGGLADIEWTVQLLQMQHAATVPGLRTSRTLEALVAAREAELLSESDADTLVSGWRWVSRVRNAITLVRGRGSDQLPHDIRERAAVANVLGYPAGATDEMVNDHLRTMRVSHAVVDRVFWE